MNAIKRGLSKLIYAVKLPLVAGLLSLLILPAAVLADNVVGAFSTKQELQPGLIVSLDNTSARTVTSAPANNTNSIYGVVIDPADAPLTLSGQNSEVFVATDGIYRVLVSTSGGTIKTGDYISMSSISGVGAKATSLQPTILGQAQGGFDGRSNVITTNGGSPIGRIYVSISVKKNPLAASDPAIPSFLKRAASSLANKQVPTARIYTALAIFVITAAVSMTILWSGVKSSLVSLGRNPLSRHSIFRGMYKVIFTGLGVFAIGLAGVYLLLKI